MASPAEKLPNLEPEPQPLSDDEIISGLMEVEKKWGINGLVAHYSPWVKSPERAYEILERLRDDFTLELKRRQSSLQDTLDIDLFKEIRTFAMTAREQAEHSTSKLVTLGKVALDRVRGLF